MSILSQLLRGKIGVGEALKEAETWFVNQESRSPLAASIGNVVSNAAGLAGTAFATAIVPAVAAIEGWVNAGIVAVVTPVAGAAATTQLTAATDLALTTLEQHAVAAVQAEIARFRASLAPAPIAVGASASASAAAPPVNGVVGGGPQGPS